MNEEQLNILKNVRNALDDIYDKLNIKLYKKNNAAKVSYTETNPCDLVASNLEYIVKHLNDLRDYEENNDGE
jgi:hypothetical protein